MRVLSLQNVLTILTYITLALQNAWLTTARVQVLFLQTVLTMMACVWMSPLQTVLMTTKFTLTIQPERCEACPQYSVSLTQSRDPWNTHTQIVKNSFTTLLKSRMQDSFRASMTPTVSN